MARCTPVAAMLSLKTKLSSALDSFATEFLGDAPAQVVSDHSTKLGPAKTVSVKRGFTHQEISEGFRIFRRLFALITFVGIFVWLALDISLAHGLVPGIQDTFNIQAELPEGAAQAVTTTTICTCTYNQTDTFSPHPPYAVLAPNQAHWPGFNCPDTFLQLCSSDSSIGSSAALQQRLLQDNRTASEQFVYNTLATACVEIIKLKVTSPIAAVQLERVAWGNARYNDVTRHIEDISNRARAIMEVAGLAPTNLPNDTIDLGMGAVTAMEASFMSILRALMNMTVKNATVTVAQDGTRTTLACAGLPEDHSRMPFTLQERCVDDNERFQACTGSADAAYKAYTKWCAPGLCHVIGPKSTYQRSMESLSALGGLYGIVQLCLFAILWRFCVMLATHMHRHRRTIMPKRTQGPAPPAAGKSCSSLNSSSQSDGDADASIVLHIGDNGGAAAGSQCFGASLRLSGAKFSSSGCGQQQPSQ